MFTPADLGLNDSFDGNALMNQVLTNVQNQGYRVQGSVQVVPLNGGQGALLYAVVLGPENGYIALEFAPGVIAYITATGDAQSITTDQNTLFAILQSVQIPAAGAQGSGGLGNPFGPPATPAPTKGGGLGLPLATAAPTQGGQIVPLATAAPTQGGGQIVPFQTATPAEGGGHIVPVQPTQSN